MSGREARPQTLADAEAEAARWAASCRSCSADLQVTGVDVERARVTFTCGACGASRVVRYDRDAERRRDDDE